MSKKRFIKNYATSAVSIRILLRILSALKTAYTRFLQVTFPELENILSSPTGKQYWNLVMAFPCNSFVLELDDAELTAIIRQSTAKRISEKRVTYLVDKLTKLANQSYCEVKKTSPMMEEIKYYAGGVT